MTDAIKLHGNLGKIGQQVSGGPAPIPDGRTTVSPGATGAMNAIAAGSTEVTDYLTAGVWAHANTVQLFPGMPVCIVLGGEPYGQIPASAQVVLEIIDDNTIFQDHANVIGLSLGKDRAGDPTDSNGFAPFIASGILQLTTEQWDFVNRDDENRTEGQKGLSTGFDYFLSDENDGQILQRASFAQYSSELTPAPPISEGNWIVRIGVALDPMTMCIQICKLGVAAGG